MSFIVEEALTDEQIIDCHDTITEVLRPHLKDIKDYVSRVHRQQSNHGYHLMFVRNENGKAVSILGYRITENLWDGKILYINDLTTHSSSRGRGCADTLMSWAIQTAKELDCDAISLDSGYSRHDAHRFYLNHGFIIESHHFKQKLK